MSPAATTASGYPARALAASATAPGTVLPGQVGLFFKVAPISNGTAWVFQPDGLYRADAAGLSYVADLKILAAASDASGLSWAAGEHAGNVSPWLLRAGAL